MPETVPYRHGKVADKIKAYLYAVLRSMDEQEQLNAKEYISKTGLTIEVGLCFGLSITYAYMFDIGKEEWWLNALTCFSEWDEQLASLTEENRLLFERIVNYVLFAQADNGAIDLLDLNQSDFLVPGKGFFDSEMGTIKSYLKLGAYFTERTFQQLFQPESCEFPGIILILSESHTCCIKNQGASWLFYDCNSRRPPLKNLTVSELYEEINISVEGKAFTIEMASWEERALPKMIQFKKLFYQLFLENPSEMIQDVGIYHFIKESPAELGSILARAENNALVRSTFFNSLLLTLESKQNILAYLMEQVMTKRLMERLIILVQKNPENLKKLIEAFEMTLSHENKEELKRPYRMFINCLQKLDNTPSKRERDLSANQPQRFFYRSESVVLDTGLNCPIAPIT